MINRLLEEITSRYKKHFIALAGDYNINSIEHSKLKDSFLEITSENGLHYAFTEPSRTTAHSKSCIDNIFVNISPEKYTTETINLHLGDHQGQLLSFLSGKPENKTVYVNRRYYTKENIEKFKSLLDKESWIEVYSSQGSAEEIYEVFHSRLQHYFKVAFPIQIRKGRKKLFNINWDTENLTRMKNQLDAIHTIITVTGDIHFMEMYKDLKNIYQTEINKAKKDAISKYITSSTNKQKSAWNVIKWETGRNTSRTTQESPLSSDDFNQYFSNIGIGNSQTNPEKTVKLLHRNTTNSIFLSYTDPHEIEKIINKFKNKTTGDVDDFSVATLKKIKECISIPLSYITNKCIDEGVFPSKLKRAKIVPIHKKGNTHEPENYRPIALLTVISKVFETIIKNRLKIF